MTKQEISSEQLLAEITHFRCSQKTLQMASCSQEHLPLASYAPFVCDEQGDFFVLLSNLAHHSQNLKHHHTCQLPLSILLIEDEQNAKNIFARKRLSYQCQVDICAKTDPLWPAVIEKLKDKFDKTIEVLIGLSDFNLYRLKPIKGNYVRGFGQAYELADAKIPIIRTAP